MREFVCQIPELSDKNKYRENKLSRHNSYKKYLKNNLDKIIEDDWDKFNKLLEEDESFDEDGDIGKFREQVFTSVKPLKTVHKDIDVVTTPDGSPVAMVHTNNCSSDINAWTNLFGEFAKIIGSDISQSELYARLFNHTKIADRDAGGLVSFNCLSGENITGVEVGRPLFIRTADSKMNLSNFILMHLYSAFAPLKIGMDILIESENIEIDSMVAQGGLFKTPCIAQQILADAVNIPITVMETAGEGGAWGMAVLAVFAMTRDEGETLADFLDRKVFRDVKGITLKSDPEGVAGYQKFIDSYQRNLPIEIKAGQVGS